MKDEKADSDVQQQYQQQAQQPETNSEPQPPISPHSEIPQRQTTSKQRLQYTGDVRRVVDRSIPTQRNMRPHLPLTFGIPPSVEQALTLTQLTSGLAQPQQHQQQSRHAHPQPPPPRFAYPTIDQQLTEAPTTQHQAAPRPPPLTPGNLIATAEASLACPRPFSDPQEGPRT